MRITAQLIDAADGYHLWSDRYDRELTEAFTIQDEIARAIARSLHDNLAPVASLPRYQPNPLASAESTGVAVTVVSSRRGLR